MAVISGVLKGPMGDVRVGVVIELRAVRTSATVVIQARSQSVTDETGRYTLSVEPGQYDVMITTAGRQPERVGGIQVMVNSATGTLNDFLTIPGETDLNPAIVATVDGMRAAAAASAAAAKTSENNAAATLANAVKKGEFGIGGVTPAMPLINTLNAVKSQMSGKYVAWAGSEGMPRIDTAYMLDWTLASTSGGVSQGVVYATALITAPSSFDQVYRNVCRNGVFQGWKVMWDDNSLSNAMRVGDYGLGADYRSGLEGYTLASNYRINGAFYAGSSTMTDTFNNSSCHIFNISGNTTRAFSAQIAIPSLTAENKIALRRIVNNTVGRWDELLSTANTTIDANGFIKKASPIVKLFGDGQCELNDQSQGVTTERVSEGVYRVSGVLGFNGDGAWGGAGNGIEIPVDDNKRALVWIESTVLSDGDIEIRTYHRTYETGPYSARNIEAMDSGEVDKKKRPIFVEMPDGTPIDIPAGRFIDLRVEMPAGDEPEYEPVLEDEAPEVSPDVTEPEGGEEPAATEQPKE